MAIDVMAALRALIQQADADAPEVPPTPDPPAPTPPPVAPLPEAGTQAIVDAVLAAPGSATAGQPTASGTATRAGLTASAAGSGQAVGWASGQPPDQRQERIAAAHRRRDGAGRRNRQGVG